MSFYYHITATPEQCADIMLAAEMASHREGIYSTCLMVEVAMAYENCPDDPKAQLSSILARMDAGECDDEYENNDIAVALEFFRRQPGIVIS